MTSNSHQTGLTTDQALSIVLDSAAKYEQETPLWFVEGVFSLARRALQSLQHFIDDTGDGEIDWERPHALLQFPADWDWDNWQQTSAVQPVAMLTDADLATQEKALDSMLTLARKLHDTYILQRITRSAVLVRRSNDITVILPEVVDVGQAQTEEEVAALLDKHFRPVDLKRAILAVPNLEVPKELRRSLLRGSMTFRSHHGDHPFAIDMGLGFYPLEVDLNSRTAHFPVKVELRFRSRTLKHPGHWSKREQRSLWSSLIGSLTTANRDEKGAKKLPRKRQSEHDVALLARVRPRDEKHLEKLKERVLNTLAPHVVSVQVTELTIASDTADVEFMALAVAQARMSRSEAGAVRPKVGVVVVSDGRVLATAHRGEEKLGEHAEYTALVRKLEGVDLSRATVFTTLEPCTRRNHPKKPCVHWLIERKVARVVIGTLDPNDTIKGEGVILLREADIPVQLFTETHMKELELLNKDFFAEHRRARK